MNKIKSFFCLVRWTNLFMIATMMLLVYHCVMSPLSYYLGPMALPPSYTFYMLVMSLVFIVAGGYVVNDCFDVVTDEINKPDKLLVDKVFTKRQSLFFYGVLTFVGVLLGLLSSIMILQSEFYLLFAVLLLITCLLYSYSSTYKRKFFVGNFVVSLLVSSSVFLPYLFEILYLSNNVSMLFETKDLVVSVLYFVLIYTAFAFLLTFIREIVKDVEDYEGDIKIHCQTIPVVCGVNATKTTLYVLISLLLLLLAVYGYVLFGMELYVAMGIMMVIALCSVLLAVMIYRAKTQKDFHNSSAFAKVMMLIGLLSMIFLR